MYVYGITIGPIVKSLIYASHRGENKTRSLWKASYFFSFTMKKLIQSLNQHVNMWYLPDPFEALDGQNEQFEMFGLYPDRAIFRSSANLEDIKNVIQNTINLVEAETDIGANYLKVDIVVIPCSDSPGKDQIKIQKLLDHQELAERPQGSFVNHAIDRLINSHWMRHKLSEIPTTKEIAQKVKDFERKHTHYMAFVQSDGDKVGRLLSTLNTDQELRNFSTAMLEYAKKAGQAVSEYGGFCFYTGGDDLLAAVPIYNGEKTVFELIEQLNATLKEVIRNQFRDKKYEELVNEVSLSAGIAMAHYKHQMAELLEHSANLLFNSAKNDPKDAIAIRLEKHSGTHTSLRLTRKHASFFYDTIKLFNDTIRMEEQVVQDHLFSVRTKLFTHRALLMEVLKLEEIEEQKKMLDHYFQQQFNEKIHQSYLPFFEDIKKLIINAADQEQDPQKALDLVISVLYVAKFFTEKRDEQDERMERIA